MAEPDWGPGLRCPACQKAIEARSLLGPFQILRRLIADGRATDWHIGIDSRDATPVLLRSLRPGPDDPERAIALFAERAARLLGLAHPNVARLLGWGVAEGVPFLAYESLPGQTLERRLAAGAIPERELIALATGITRGLLAGEEIGIGHGHLSPSQILVDAGGNPKLVDFTLLPDRADERRAADRPPDDLPYLAPEELGAPPTPATLQYNLGALLFRAASGRHPFRVANLEDLARRHREQKRIPVRAFAPRLSAALADLIDRCRQHDPAARFPDLRSMLAALERGPETSPTPARPATAQGAPAPRDRARRRSVGWPIPATLAACALVGLFAWWQTNHPNPATPDAIAPPQLTELVISTADGRGADAYVEGGPSARVNKGTGTEALTIKNGPRADQYSRKVYLRFDLAALAGRRPASARLDVGIAVNDSGEGDPKTGEFLISVLALPDGYPGQDRHRDGTGAGDGDTDDPEDIHGEFWPENVIQWESAPANDTTHGARFSPECQTLGSFTITEDRGPGTTASFSSPDLARFLASDTNGVVTLLLRRDGTSAGARANLRFHSKESSKGAFKPLLHVLVEEPATAVAP